ncbi:MAG: CaiB/BaiF CoA-transferase family protein [Pseudonocardiales bacterium]|jgi:alpha-methylacyl-CoA racemase|nr:CaiB/BaiF CoA-transferase family protein [Pseudonocardiales bacterium]
MTAGTGPLAGIRVLDLSALAPGPFATTLLGDLGADVITLEAPPAARPGSGVGDLGVHGGREARRLGLSPLHRSRRSIVVNLKDPAGLDIALRLAARSDVFVEGFRPGVCERLGLGYPALSATSPGLVYCSLTGYGQTGELAQHAGHDLNYIAEAGLLSATTRAGQRPGIPLNMAADYAAGGLLAAFGILAGLTGRASTGRGTHVDVSMYEGLLSLLQVVPAWVDAGAPDPSWGGGLLSGAVPFYDCYRTSDDRWISVGALEPKFFANLCTALGRPELIALQNDPTRWDEMRTVFTATFAEAPLDTWLDRLGAVDTAVAPVRSLPDAFATAHRRGVLPAPGQVGPVPRMSGWVTTAGPVVTRPGAHTREVLGGLEMTGEQIDELIAAGVVAE